MTGRVAVIGAGPAGLVAARWLLSQGFQPTIFEQAPILGGQWAGHLGSSGVWPGMHTNTSRVMTAFSDLEHDSDLVHPSNRDILNYLHRCADVFGLLPIIRFGTRVENLRRCDTGWIVSCEGSEASFDRVALASGRFHTPRSHTFRASPLSTAHWGRSPHTITWALSLSRQADSVGRPRCQRP